VVVTEEEEAFVEFIIERLARQFVVFVKYCPEILTKKTAALLAVAYGP